MTLRSTTRSVNDILNLYEETKKTLENAAIPSAASWQKTEKVVSAIESSVQYTQRVINYRQLYTGLRRKLMNVILRVIDEAISIKYSTRSTSPDYQLATTSYKLTSSKL